MQIYKVFPQVLIASAGEISFSVHHCLLFKIQAIPACGGAFLYGIVLGWSAPMGPKILSSENEFRVTKSELSWAVAVMPLGCAMFCLLSGIIRNRFGTKVTIFIFGLPNILGVLLMIFAQNALLVGSNLIVLRFYFSD